MAISSCSAEIEDIVVSVFDIPTDEPESDGTLEWDHTTLVLVEATAANTRGLGYTYADRATAILVQDVLARTVKGRDAMDVRGTWSDMVSAIRNLGRPRYCVHGHRLSRQRFVGFEGAPARDTAGETTRHGA